MRLFLLLPLLALPGVAAAIELHNVLGDDQRSETISVSIDGREIGRLHVDAKRPEASLDLPLDGDRHRYRISGEAVMADGSKLAIAGGGLVVSSAEMDRIAEARDAATAIAGYEELLAALKSAAPEFSSADFALTRGAPASEAELKAAEQRLGRALPKGYRNYLAKHGSLRVGDPRSPAGVVLAPAEVMTLEDFVLAKARENESDAAQIAEMRAFIGKRFAEARRDLVLDVWQDEYPSVVRADKRCAPGQLPYVFPESQWEVLMGVGLDDNPFLGLVSYEDDIVGEVQCLGFERELAYSLHDQLVEEADDVLYLLAEDEAGIAIERGDIGEGHDGLWFRFTEHDE
jgi:hypothetical protein